MRLSGPRSPAIAGLSIRAANPHSTPGPPRSADLLDADGQTRRRGHRYLVRRPRAPTPPKTSSKSPATARPSSCATVSTGPSRAGARLAEPGEFTLRAFLNGRIDLPQAEAVRDLIDATTLYQARIAAQQTQGSVSRPPRPGQSAASRTDRASRSRHRLRRGRHQRRTRIRDAAPSRPRHSSRSRALARSFVYGQPGPQRLLARHRGAAQCGQKQPI